MNAPNTAVRTTLALERNPFARSAFLGVATRLPGPLFVHEDVRAGLVTLASHPVATVFASRRILLEAPVGQQHELVDTLVRARAALVVLHARGEPRELGSVMYPVAAWAPTPCAPETLVALAHGNIPAALLAAAVEVSAPPASWDTPRLATPPAVSAFSRPGFASLLQTPPATPVPTTDALLRAERLMQVDVERLAPHEVLGVPREAGRREVLGAYLALVRRFHPDALGALTDPTLRAAARGVYRRITDAWQTMSASMDAAAVAASGGGRGPQQSAALAG
jgi:hypothetical protein